MYVLTSHFALEFGIREDKDDLEVTSSCVPAVHCR
jgi:hypothetical protein